MIAHLRGSLLFKDSNAAIIDVNGVGYEVLAPTSVLDGWLLEAEISAHICTVVREDSFQLFGFASAAQKSTFEILRGVNKIGAKLALTILSHLDVNQLATAIQTKNAATLSAIPGIGKKTAERMCLELKDKIAGELVLPAGTIGSKVTITPIKKEDPLQLALAQLDYRKSEIDVALKSDSVPSMEDASLQDRLRAALRVLASHQ
jgi:Holliday junction DNA helicase RuvA